MVEKNQNQDPNKTEIPSTAENLFPFIDPDSFPSKEAYNKARDEYLISKPVRIIPYETLEGKGKYGADILRFKSGLLENVICSFGKVSFDKIENTENIKLFFEYDVDTQKSLHPFNMSIPESKQQLETLLGDFLMTCIEEQARNKTILFRGGKEEMQAYTKTEK